MASMIDRYLVRYFLAVVDWGNFSKAAVHCNVSQQTLSVGIAKLERLLAAPVFRRTNRRVELTAAGVQFTAHARRIEAEFALAEQAIAGLDAVSTTRIGVLDTVPSQWLADIAGKLKSDVPGTRVEFVEGREGDLLERLNRCRIDVAFTLVRPGGHFKSEALVTEGYAVAMADSHPLAGRAVVNAEDLGGDVMIARRNCEVLLQTSRHFTSRGVRPFFAARTRNDDRALALVRAGLGVTVMPDGFRSAGIARSPLAGFELTRTLGLVRSTAEPLPGPIHVALRGAIMSLREREPTDYDASSARSR
jgi:DNA-binding transcriptional LysR family regulator